MWSLVSCFFGKYSKQPGDSVEKERKTKDERSCNNVVIVWMLVSLLILFLHSEFIMGGVVSKVSVPAARSVPTISTSEFRPFTIAKITKLTHNVKKFKVEATLNGELPVSSMIMVRIYIEVNILR